MVKGFLFVLMFSLFLVGAPLGSFASDEEPSTETPATPPPEFEYLELRPMILPVITDQGLTQQVSMVISLELPYGKKNEVQIYEPRLTDAYFQDLYGALGSGLAMMKGDVLDLQAVKTRLTDVTTKVLGPDKVKNVLLQVVRQRQM